MQCCLRHVGQSFIKKSHQQPAWLKRMLELTTKVLLAKWFDQNLFLTCVIVLNISDFLLFVRFQNSCSEANETKPGKGDKQAEEAGEGDDEEAGEDKGGEGDEGEEPGGHNSFHVQRRELLQTQSSKALAVLSSFGSEAELSLSNMKTVVASEDEMPPMMPDPNIKVDDKAAFPPKERGDNTVAGRFVLKKKET